MNEREQEYRDRFLDKVSPEPNSGCWLWIGAMRNRGYGSFQFRGGQWRAHRAAYEMFIGPIPDGLFVTHSCDTPSCVNPRHLSVGTHTDNMRDMRGRDRSLRGTRHRDAKLTEDDVREIRSSSNSQRTLAKRYGVHQGAIYLVQKRKTWKHVE